jgi:hypothetical protein
MIFNYFLLKYVETHFTLMFSLIAAIFGAGFITMCLNVKEGEYPPAEVNSDDPRAGGFFAAVGIYCRECFSRPYYLWCFAAITLGTVTFVPFNTFSIYYAKQLNVDIGRYGELVTYCYFTSMCLAYVLGWSVDKFHSLRIGITTMALYAFSTLWGFIYAKDARTYEIALVAHVVLSGCYFTATASLAQALLPRAKFAQFASAAVVLTSIARMVVGPSLGFILDHTNHNYRLTFLAGLILCLITIIVMLIVYRQFLTYGGHKSYVAPGDAIPAGGSKAGQPHH